MELDHGIGIGWNHGIGEKMLDWLFKFLGLKIFYGRRFVVDQKLLLSKLIHTKLRRKHATIELKG